MIKLVANLALISSFFRPDFALRGYSPEGSPRHDIYPDIGGRRKYSDILLRFPRGICTNLPVSSKPPSSTMACQCGLNGGAQPTRICSRDLCMVSPCGLDACDTLGVVPAKNELLNDLGDSLDTESAVDDSVFAFVLFSDALKILSKQELEVIDTARPVHPLGDRGDRKG